MVGYCKKKGSLEPIQGRPQTGPCGHVSASILLRISSYRAIHPNWSAATIRQELALSDSCEEQQLPSVRSINRYLSFQKLTKEYGKNRPLGTGAPPVPTFIHECWQMDDKGPERYGGVGHVGVINIKDGYSGVHVQSFGVPLPHTRSHPTMSDYQCALRLSFMEFGLPKRVQADHGSNFYENRCKSPFPTPLHLWLLGMGIHLDWSRTYRPTDQSKVERSHQTMHNQMVCTKDYKDMEHFQQQLNERRHRLNYHLPCATNNGKPPLVAFPQAKHSGQYYNPALEESRFDELNIIQYLIGKEWFRKLSANNTISLGGNVHYVPKVKPNRELRVTVEAKCDLSTKQHITNLLFFDVNEQVASVPLAGINFDALAGEDFIMSLKNTQLQLPFEWTQIRNKYTTFCPVSSTRLSGR